jgi:uncharacterized protein (TIGR02001 family)
MKRALLTLALSALAFPAAAEVSGYVTATNHYMSRGTEQNVYGHPAVQGGVNWSNDRGFYFNVFASTMNFGEVGWGISDVNTTKELDFFGGKKTTFGKTVVDVGFASINYPGNHAEWNFVEYDLKIDHPVGKGNIGAWIGYTDRYFALYGPGLWTEVHGSYPVTEKLSASVSVANQALENDFDYRTWNVGATYMVTPSIALDVRYWDTDRHDLDPIFDSYGEKVAVSLTKSF